MPVCRKIIALTDWLGPGAWVLEKKKFCPNIQTTPPNSDLFCDHKTWSMTIAKYCCCHLRSENSNLGLPKVLHVNQFWAKPVRTWKLLCNQARQILFTWRAQLILQRAIDKCWKRINSRLLLRLAAHNELARKWGRHHRVSGIRVRGLGKPERTKETYTQRMKAHLDFKIAPSTYEIWLAQLGFFTKVAQDCQNDWWKHERGSTNPQNRPNQTWQNI